MTNTYFLPGLQANWRPTGPCTSLCATSPSPGTTWAPPRRRVWPSAMRWAAIARYNAESVKVQGDGVECVYSWPSRNFSAWYPSLVFFRGPQITHCSSIPCMISAPNECLWTDWVIERKVSGQQAKHFACIKRSDGSCAWYRGAAPPKKDFLDIEDP